MDVDEPIQKGNNSLSLCLNSPTTWLIRLSKAFSNGVDLQPLEFLFFFIFFFIFLFFFLKGAIPQQTLDFEAMAFHQGSHFMSNKKVNLPDGSYREQKKGYEEVYVPATKPAPRGERLVTIGEMPEWAQPCFQGMKTLNPVQSKVYPTAFSSDENMLVCAPTGAGKTNVALLTVMHELGNHRRVPLPPSFSILALTLILLPILSSRTNVRKLTSISLCLLGQWYLRS